MDIIYNNVRYNVYIDGEHWLSFLFKFFFIKINLYDKMNSSVFGGET
jgi:hypothetical protein